VTRIVVNVYEDHGKWWWRLKDNYGRVIATGGESFLSEREACESVADMLTQVKTSAVDFG